MMDGLKPYAEYKESGALMLSLRKSAQSAQSVDGKEGCPQMTQISADGQKGVLP